MQHSPRAFVIVTETKERKRLKVPHLDLVEACRRGEEAAQFKLYDLYYRAMYNTALRIVSDGDDAEDVMQEAFLKAFMAIGSYRGEVPFGAWLKRITVNKALDFLRQKKESISLEQVDESLAGEALQEQEEDRESLPEYSSEKIRKAIMELPEGYRIVLSLILLEGYDHEEVSQILGISNVASRTQFHRAKKKLTGLLGPKN